MTRVYPLDGLRIAKTWHSSGHARRIACRSRIIIIDEARVISPAVYHQGNKQLHVQPQVEPVLGLLLADVMHGIGLVKDRIDLTASIAGN